MFITANFTIDRKSNQPKSPTTERDNENMVHMLYIILCSCKKMKL